MKHLPRRYKRAYNRGMRVLRLEFPEHDEANWPKTVTELEYTNLKARVKTFIARASQLYCDVQLLARARAYEEGDCWRVAP